MDEHKHHHHDEDCDCGHDHAELGPDIFTIVDEDGKEYEMEFLDAIDMDGKHYVALCESGQPDDAEAIEVSIFRIEVNDDDTEELVGLDDEDELERVYDKFLFQQDDEDDDAE